MNATFNEGNLKIADKQARIMHLFASWNVFSHHMLDSAHIIPSIMAFSLTTRALTLLLLQNVKRVYDKNRITTEYIVF